MSAESRKQYVINNFVNGLKIFIADFCNSIDLALSFELICKNNQTVIINFLGEENPDELDHFGVDALPSSSNSPSSHDPLPPPPSFLQDPFPVTSSTPNSSSAPTKSDFRHSHQNSRQHGNNNNNIGAKNDATANRTGNGREDPRRPGSSAGGGATTPVGVPPSSMGVYSPLPVSAIPLPPMSAPPTFSQAKTTEQSVFGQALRFTKPSEDLTDDGNHAWAEPDNWRRRGNNNNNNAANGNNNNNNVQSKNKNEVRLPPPPPPPVPAAAATSTTTSANKSKPEEKKRKENKGGGGAADRPENLDSTVNYLFDELELEDTPRKRKTTSAAAAFAAATTAAKTSGKSASSSASKASKAEAAAAANAAAFASTSAEAETPSPPDAKRRVRFEKKDGFVCSKCGQFFNRFRNYYLHQVKRHDKKKKEEVLVGIKDKKFKCPDCLFSSDCKREIDKHRKKYHHDLYKCSECTFSTYTRTKLNEHAQIYH